MVSPFRAGQELSRRASGYFGEISRSFAMKRHGSAVWQGKNHKITATDAKPASKRPVIVSIATAPEPP
jgi:hypothetical protein